jgi:hypothetical protein
MIGCTAGCTSGPLLIDLPVEADTTAILIGIEPDGQHLSAFDLSTLGPDQAPPALPARPTFADGDVLKVTALLYHQPATLASLGLRSGTITRAPDKSTGAVPLPFQRGYTREVTSNDPGQWTSLSALGGSFAGFQILGQEGCGPGRAPKVLKTPASGGVCAPVRPTNLCWGTPHRFAPLDRGFPHQDPGGTAVKEGGQLWFYWASDRLRADGFTDLMRSSMFDLLTPIPDTIEPVTDPPPTRNGGGSVGAPVVRADGLEMFYESNRPDRPAYLPALYQGWRELLSESWHAPTELPLGSSTSGAFSPVLLPDAKTLLYFDPSLGMTSATRSSTKAGDGGFVTSGQVVHLDDRAMSGIAVTGASLSCDGWSVIYALRGVMAHAPDGLWIASITDLATPEFDMPEPYPVRPAEDGTSIFLSAVEAPDCGALYLTDGYGLYVAERCQD